MKVILTTDSRCDVHMLIWLRVPNGLTIILQLTTTYQNERKQFKCAFFQKKTDKWP